MHLLTANQSRICGKIIRSVSCRGGMISKLARIMKLTAILLIACIHVAAGTTGQTVTLDVRNAPVATVFKEISRQTGTSIIYKESLLKGIGLVTINVRNASIQEVLDKCLQKQPLAYSIQGNKIVISPKSSRPTSEILHLLKDTLINIRGRIVNEEGEGVVASIVVKETQNGTTSDNSGYFELKGVNEHSTLVVGGVSVETKEVLINGKSDFLITVKAKITEVEEVIVNAGYYKVKERERTGNISTIRAKDIKNQPVSNPLIALQGRMPGVYVQQTTGVPGGDVNVQIRGRNSLRAIGNAPLYVIDGNPINSPSLITYAGQSIIGSGNVFNNINSLDIESIEILKDADATSIYGSRGANGVILITTKKPFSEKTNVDINLYTGIGQVSNKLDLLNTTQWLEMRHEALNHDGMTPGSYDVDDDLLNWDTTRYTDWQKELIGGTANITRANLNISGGSKNTSFIIGGSYYRETTVFPGDFSDQRTSLHVNTTHTSLNRKFKTSLISNFSLDNNNLLQNDYTAAAMQLAPVAPKLYTEGSILNWENSTWGNPLARQYRTYSGQTRTWITNLSLAYQILDDFTFKTSVGYSFNLLKDIVIRPIKSFDPAFTFSTGTATRSTNFSDSWIFEPQLDYFKTIGSNLTVNGIVGLTYQTSDLNVEGLSASGYASDALIKNLSSAVTIRSLGSETNQYRYLGLFARLNLVHHDKYILNLTGRRDGSSRFGPGKQYATFGALGTAWIFSEERFLKDHIGGLSFGKVRLSYGTTGSDQIGDYGYLDTYSPTNYPYGNIAGLTPTSLVNPRYGWETSRKFEGGLELGLLKDRINFNLIFYQNRTSNQLVGYPLPLMTGFSSIQYNLPATVENSGWEFSLTTRNVTGKNVNWVTSINFTIPDNRLVEYPDIEASSYANIYKVGKSLYIQKLLRYTGVNPVTGIYTFEDVNNDGSISDVTDKQFSKEVSRKFFGGIQNTLTFKTFQLDLFFQFVKQTGWNYLSSFLNPPGTSYSNQPTLVLNRWKGSGDVTDIQKFTQVYDEAYIQYQNLVLNSDKAISDASFIRLKNVSISYSLPNKLNKKLHLGNAQIYIQGQNLFTISNYLGLDPDNATRNGSNILPSLRILTAGIQITFNN